MDVADPPRTQAALKSALEGFRPELQSGPSTLEVVRFLRHPPLPLPALPVYRVLWNAAVDLLPPWLRAARRAATGAGRAVGGPAGCADDAGSLRLVLGSTSPGERAARLRLADPVSRAAG